MKLWGIIIGWALVGMLIEEGLGEADHVGWWVLGIYLYYINWKGVKA